MPDMVLRKEEESSWVSYIKQRIRKNKNFLGFVSGPTGSGKSYTSLRICEEVDPEFNIDRVVFRGKELMDLINSGNLKKGSAILFEEAGIEMSNRSWQSVTNKMLNFLVQTFRHRNFVLIMNSPFMDFVDAATRKLFHAEFITLNINLDTCKVKLKPQLLQYNSRLQKFYYKYLRVITTSGVIPVARWSVSKPSPELVKAYEIKKLAFTTQLNAEIYEELNSIKDNKKKHKDLTSIQEDIVGLLSKGLTVPEIAKERNRAPNVIYESIRLIKNKGYKVDAVLDVKGRVQRYSIAPPEP